MMSRNKIEEITVSLTQTLAEYEVIPANWGWHIHQGDEYYGYLEYQEEIGWKGNALNKLPTREKEQVKKLALSSMNSTLVAI